MQPLNFNFGMYFHQTRGSNGFVIRAMRTKSLELQIDGEVVLNGGHDAAYEFKEDEQALRHLRLATVGLYRFDDRFHDLGVVTWMDARLLHIDVWMLFHGHCLLGVVGCDVLKYFCLAEGVAVFVVACEPQTGGLSVEIVCYAQVVFPNLEDQSASLGLHDVILAHFLLLLLLLGEHVSVVIIIVYVVQVDDTSRASLRCLIIIIIYNLHSASTHSAVGTIIKVQNLGSLRLFRVDGLNPAIFSVDLQLLRIVLVVLLQVGNSFLAWHAAGYQKLFVGRQVLISFVLFSSHPSTQQIKCQ